MLVYELLLILTICINITADFIDRSASNKSDPYVLTLWTSIVQFLLIFPIVGLVGGLTMPQLLLVVATSVLASYGRVRWFRALMDRSNQLSRLSPLTRVSSIFVLFLAVTVLGESFTRNQAIGAALIIAGAFLVSFERWSASLSEFLTNNKALGLVLIFAISTACLSVLYKYLLMASVSIWTIYFYVRLCQTVPLVLYGANQNIILKSYQKIANLKLFVFGRVLQTAAAFLYLLVIKHLDLTTAEPIVALSPLIFLFAEHVTQRVSSARLAEPEEKEVGSIALRTTIFRVLGIVVSTVGIIFLKRS